MEQVKVKITHTCERRVVDAKGNATGKVLREGTVVVVDVESAETLKALGYAVAA